MFYLESNQNNASELSSKYSSKCFTKKNNEEKSNRIKKKINKRNLISKTLSIINNN